MTQFETWKLIADIGLFGSLLYFAWRHSRMQSGANPHQLQELHSSLRAAIREADQTGKNLAEQLITRKQNLEKVMLDIETAENRLNKVLNAADEAKAELEFQISKAKHFSQEAAPAPRSAKRDMLAGEETAEAGLAADDFKKVVSEGSAFNIFGEPISAGAEEYAPVKPISAEEIQKAFNNTPLTQRIEKQIELTTPVSTTNQPKKVSPEEVYAQAEELLRAGRAIEEVSRETKLTADEVRMLSQMLESEMQSQMVTEAAPAATDSRLGVLAGFKRQVQVL